MQAIQDCSIHRCRLIKSLDPHRRDLHSSPQDGLAALVVEHYTITQLSSESFGNAIAAMAETGFGGTRGGERWLITTSPSAITSATSNLPSIMNPPNLLFPRPFRQKKNPSSHAAKQNKCFPPILTPLIVPMVLGLSTALNFPALGEIITDPDSVRWASRSNMSSDDFADEFTERKNNGYMLTDIEVNEVGGNQRVSGVWQKNLDGRQWAEYRNMTDERFSERWSDFNDRGYRLIDQESYVLGGSRYYAGIWIENVEGYKWKSYRNLTNDSYVELFNDSKDEYIPVDIEAYTVGGSSRYACIWVENKENLQWYSFRGLSDSEFSVNFATYKDNYRIHDIESYRVGGNQRYAVIWIKNTNGRQWAEYRDMTREGYLNRLYRFIDRGYRLTDFEEYNTSSGIRYAGVWRQNNDRHDWPLRSTVDRLSQTLLDTNNIDGLGVAVVHQGKILYQRGFGYQDDDGTWYSAKTINRLASVSKAVGGVLLYKLDELGLIDPTAQTSDYVAMLPAHHEHTLNDLASCRSQVGHYLPFGNADRLLKPESPTSTSSYNTAVNLQYNTALSASPLFWDRALVANTATDSAIAGDTTSPYYHYSTHGYTLLGAAMEDATGKSISKLVDQYMGTGIGLPTLKVEDSEDDNYFRTEVFHNNSVVSPDNTSWKVLGGGLEASAEDMALFCKKLMAGEILSPASLQTLWTRPDSSWTYAMGWQSWLNRSGQNVRSVMKNGAQLGAGTHVRLFPDLELGVIVLCNTKQNSGTASALTLSISNAALSTLPPVLSVVPESKTIDFGESTLLSVTGVSNEPMSYQWRKDGVNIPGATDSALFLSAESRADIGNYSVVVSNSAGSVVSGNASIYVLTPQIVEPVGLMEDGGFRLRFGDKDGHPLTEPDRDHFSVEWSSDLKKWSTIPSTSYSVVDGKIVADDLTASGVGYRYYRVRQY